MKNRAYLLLLLFFFLQCPALFGKVIELKPDSTGKLQDDSFSAVGRIYTVDRKRLGTAFVAGKNHNIFTVAHVALKDTLLFRSFKSKQYSKMFLKYKLASLDLAIYERVGGDFDNTYGLGEFDKVNPGDTIYYCGWVSDTKLTAGKSLVSAKGKMMRGTEVIDYIEFSAKKGVPGYSGGPVFNLSGEVVALISQGWDYTPIKSKIPIRVLRAFSVDILRYLENDLKTNTRSISTTKNDIGILYFNK